MVIPFTPGYGRIHADDIDDASRERSEKSLDELLPLVSGGDRHLVFFVGAGASYAGATGMPRTPSVLRQVLTSGVERAGASSPMILDALLRALPEWDAPRLGFEITLNDLLQISPESLAAFFAGFANLEATCSPNRVHSFLARWIDTGGSVLTTNYDRLIERAKPVGTIPPAIRFTPAEGPASFATWRADLDRGGVLFKIHGSFDDLATCAGALEHVGTIMRGDQADLVRAVMYERPICFVGWQGIDPDIPPLLAELLLDRSSSLPIFWIHWEGPPDHRVRLDEAIASLPPLTRPIASRHPILTDAERLFTALMKPEDGLGHDSIPRLTSTSPSTAWPTMSECRPSGAARFVGIALRRAGEVEAARQMLVAARDVADATSSERAAALSELSLTCWASSDTSQEERERQALRLAEQARAESVSEPNQSLGLNNDFGLFSMTVVAARRRPWLLFRIPALFWRYRSSIARLKQSGLDPRSTALHEALLALYVGRLRLQLAGPASQWLPWVGDWCLAPFDAARDAIRDAADIHLHSHLDVLAYRAVALSRCSRCTQAIADIDEIERLCRILNDAARTAYWQDQRHEIERRCAEG